MGMNETPSADRVHIGFFGRRNAGKSSIVNKVTGQELAVVSDVKGTTTDPVSKAMELLPMGPVVIIDTPGIDDEGHLGELRVRKAKQVLNRVDVAVLVVDATLGKTNVDEELIHIFKEKEIPYLVVYNKSDLLSENQKINADSPDRNQEPFIYASAATGQNIYELKEKIASLAVTDDLKLRLVGDLLEPSDFAVLVVPIDKAAPKGRLILPQQQTIRDVLEAGAAAIDRLKDGDKILISEGCTHHRQCDDIGTVKLPRWIRNYTGKDLEFEYSSGRDFPEDVTKYNLIVHCGGCMINEREMRYRQKCALDQEIPITNYGIAIAYMQGILKRCVEMFPDVRKELDV